MHGFKPSRRRSTRLLALALCSVAMLFASAAPVSAKEYTYNPPGACSAFTVSGFEYYGRGASGVRDRNGDCGSMTPNVTWHSYAQGTNRTYCSATTSDYKRCTGYGDWQIAHGLAGGAWYNLYR